MKLSCIILLVLAIAVPPLFAADAAQGKALYAKSCKGCHGPDGSGNPAIAKAMKVTLKPLGSAEVQGKSDAELEAVITKGTGKMKPVASVAGKQVDDVIAYLRTLKQ